MRKKLKMLAAMLCLVIFALMALGSGSSDSDEKKEVVAADADEVSEEAETTEEVEEEAAETEEAAAVTIEEQLLLDQDGIVITAKEYVSDSIWGDGIKLLVENNTDKTVTVTCNALIVNNYMISDFFASELAAGKKANEVMYLSSAELEAAGIDSVGQIEVYFHVFDSESLDDVLNSECITIQTSEFANMDTTPDDVGTELYNANGVKIVGKTVDENSFWGTAILLYCENTSGKNVGISVDEMSVNGFMMSPFFATSVYDGKMSLDEITIFSEDLEANGIEAIEEVELRFHIFDFDTFDTIADSDPITFSAQ